MCADSVHSHSEANIEGTPDRVNQVWVWWLCACGAVFGLKIWLFSGVDLGKDEAAYWYWSQRLDASYALLPLSTLRIAELIVPHREIALRIPSALCGLISLGLMYKLCRLYELSTSTGLWTTASFASCHWIWHTTSYVHPDGFLVLCWLLTLVIAAQHLQRPSQPLVVACGAAAGLATLSKYHGALLAISVFAWFAISSPPSLRLRYLAGYAVPFLLLVSPLVYENWHTDFDPPFALGSLSRIAADDPVPMRLLLLVVTPMLFVSPALLWLLYIAMWRTFVHMRSALSGAASIPWRQAALAALPATAVIAWFGFFGLVLGQIKGNWILPAFLGVWPWAFRWTALRSGDRSRRAGRWLLAGVLVLGISQTGVIAASLKYPRIAGMLSSALGETINATYPRLVSQSDQLREPSVTWVDRVCEYSGWRPFAAGVDALLEDAAISARTPLVSTQYDLAFALAFYQTSRGRRSRASYTIGDPKFRHLSDFEFATEMGLHAPEILFAARAGLPIPPSLERRYGWRRELPPAFRSSSDCGSARYDLVLMRR